jgi:hypothetical protein
MSLFTFFSDAWQLFSLVFNTAIVVVFVANYHFSNITQEELFHNATKHSIIKLYQETFIHQILATSYRILTPFTLIFFLKAFSAVPLILTAAIQTFATWMLTKDFEKSFLASFTFFCPIQLGHQGMIEIERFIRFKL